MHCCSTARAPKRAACPFAPQDRHADPRGPNPQAGRPSASRIGKAMAQGFIDRHPPGRRPHQIAASSPSPGHKHAGTAKLVRQPNPPSRANRLLPTSGRLVISFHERPITAACCPPCPSRPTVTKISIRPRLTQLPGRLAQCSSKIIHSRGIRTTDFIVSVVNGFHIDLQSIPRYGSHRLSVSSHTT